MARPITIVTLAAAICGGGVAALAATSGVDPPDIADVLTQAVWTLRDFTWPGAIALIGLVAMSGKIAKAIRVVRGGERDREGADEVERRAEGLAIHDLQVGQKNLKEAMDTGFAAVREDSRALREDLRVILSKM